MDWDKDGMITFKEFLFAFTDWVGLENDEEESGHNNGSVP
jgi:calcium-binding protein CML